MSQTPFQQLEINRAAIEAAAASILLSRRERASVKHIRLVAGLTVFFSAHYRIGRAPVLRLPDGRCLSSSGTRDGEREKERERDGRDAHRDESLQRIASRPTDEINVPQHQLRNVGSLHIFIAQSFSVLIAFHLFCLI